MFLFQQASLSYLKAGGYTTFKYQSATEHLTFSHLGPGGVLGPKNDGVVPLAAENWTQKDRGKNEIWGLKDRIL